MKATAQMREEMDVYCCNGINSIEIAALGILRMETFSIRMQLDEGTSGSLYQGYSFDDEGPQSFG